MGLNCMEALRGEWGGGEILMNYFLIGSKFVVVVVFALVFMT